MTYLIHALAPSYSTAAVLLLWSIACLFGSGVAAARPSVRVACFAVGCFGVVCSGAVGAIAYTLTL